MLVQAVFWQNDRQVAPSAADRASAAVALYGLAGRRTPRRPLWPSASAGLRDVSVSISRGADGDDGRRVAGRRRDCCGHVGDGDGPIGDPDGRYQATVTMPAVVRGRVVAADRAWQR